MALDLVSKADRCLFTEESRREDLRTSGEQNILLNVEDLNRFDADTVVTPELMKEIGMVKQVKDGIKILGNGTLEKNLTVKAHKFSKTAVEKIESAGGKAEVI